MTALTNDRYKCIGNLLFSSEVKQGIVCVLNLFSYHLSDLRYYMVIMK